MHQLEDDQDRKELDIVLGLDELLKLCGGPDGEETLRGGKSRAVLNVCRAKFMVLRAVKSSLSREPTALLVSSESQS